MVSLNDTTNEVSQRLQQQLANEETIWLTTVNRQGMPNPSIVWFHWDGNSIFLLSQPHQGKVKAIAANPHVSLNFDSDGMGGNMLILNGTATLLDPVTVDEVPPAYFAKYAGGLSRLGYTPEQMIENYSQPIRITIDKVRGH
jgi:PPOX class probable F420-dependent enzyme